ncbi:MAG: 2'-deoxycytidine 5'-triphosphate deaminase [Candidatus Woesearchaeota archaeon]
MGLEDKLGCCLASGQIRDLIKTDQIKVGSFDESRIQPSSYEPSVGNEVFVLDTETQGLFRPKRLEQVYRTLLQLPARQRQRVDTCNGFELKKGFTYLFHLEDRMNLSEPIFVKSSPKSSFGRLFLNTRMLADYNPAFDEISPDYTFTKDLNLWLVVQPLVFNVIVYPGVTFNQLRFMAGHCQLSNKEVMQELSQSWLLYTRSVDGLIVRSEAILSDGLEIHLDLSGANNQGIVGLRARHNPSPIDLTKTSEYEAEDFFEPVKGDGKVTVSRGDHCLLSSFEILRIPAHLNVELRSHSHIGLHGPLHFAGFVDNGFEGDLVFEVRSDELSSIVLEDRMPISKLDIFRTVIPDKLYGRSIGSNYQGQVGPRPSKHFRPFDFTYAARNYSKLDRMVLVQEASLLKRHRSSHQGFEYLSPGEVDGLLGDVSDGFFQSRYDCEHDELILQPIPYVLLFGQDRNIFSYVRAKNIEDYGDSRLFGKHSIGLGGHIIISDKPDYVLRCLEREVMQEEVQIFGEFSKPKLIGTLMAYDNPVDRVHFGLIFGCHTTGSIKPKESSIISGGVLSIDYLQSDPLYSQKYETWSRVLIPNLKEIYEKTLVP